MIHTFNTWPTIFHRIKTGEQPFDIRSDMRVKAGHQIIHREYTPCGECRGTGEDSTGHGACASCNGERGSYTGAALLSEVTCISSFKQTYGTLVIGLDIISDNYKPE